MQFSAALCRGQIVLSTVHRCMEHDSMNKAGPPSECLLFNNLYQPTAVHCVHTLPALRTGRLLPSHEVGTNVDLICTPF